MQESADTWLAEGVEDSGKPFETEETEVSPADFGDSGGENFEREEPEEADPVGVPRGGFFLGLDLPMRGGGDRRRDRRRCRAN